MAFLQGLLSKLAPAISDARGVIPLLEKPDGEAINWQADENGVPYVNIGGLDESALATGAKQDAQTTVLGALQTLLTALSAKLPASLGTKLAAESLAVTLPTDLQPIRIDVPGNPMTTLRTLVAAVADTEPPIDGSTWVAMQGAGQAGLLELPIAGAITSVGGTVAPSLVTIRLWSRIGAGGAISKVYEETFPAAWLCLPIATSPYRPRYIPFNAPDALITITFADGTAPTITGTIKGRMVTAGALTSKDFPRDPATGNVLYQSASYDAATGTDKNSPAMFESDLGLEEPLVADETGKANGTYYYPSPDGILLDRHGRINWEYDLTGANGGTVAVSFEATHGSAAWATSKDVSKSGWGCVAGAAVAGTVTSGANGTISEMVQFANQPSSSANFVRMRMKVVVAGGASGAIKVSIRRSVR